MTIDPTSFEAQGKPTIAQARAVWDAMPKPSARRVAEELINRGFDAHWRTIARWKATGWREHTRTPMQEKGRIRVARETKTKRKLIPGAILDAAKQLAKGKITPPPTLDEYALIARRREELMQLSDPELDATEARARKVMNILLAEQAAARAHVMVLIPRETGQFIESLAEAQRVPLAPGGGDPRVVEGKAIEATANPITSAINRFLVSEELN